MTHRFGFVLLALAFLIAYPASAQEAPEARRVVLTDGTVLIGTIVDESADPLVLITTNGIEQRIVRDRVSEITPLYAGRFTRLDPNRTRLFVIPTGRTLGRGNGRVSTFVYLLPNVAYGATDWLDVSGSAFLVFGDGGGALVNANVKAQPVRVGGTSVAIGATASLPIGDGGADGVAGFLYGVGTFGSETTAFTTGVVGLYGFDITAGDAAFADGAAILAGVEHQVSSSIKLITENYLLVGDGVSTGFVSLNGVRLFGDRFAVDLYGVLGVFDGSVGGFAPIANFSYNF